LVTAVGKLCVRCWKGRFRGAVPWAHGVAIAFRLESPDTNKGPDHGGNTGFEGNCGDPRFDGFESVLFLRELVQRNVGNRFVHPRPEAKIK
jgi:hypothetical protein